MVDKAKMFAPNSWFPRTADPMQPYKSDPDRPLLLWQRTSIDYIDIGGVYEDIGYETTVLCHKVSSDVRHYTHELHVNGTLNVT